MSLNCSSLKINAFSFFETSATSLRTSEQGSESRKFLYLTSPLLDRQASHCQIESRMMMGVFRPKWEDVRLESYSGEAHTLYSSQDLLRWWSKRTIYYYTTQNNEMQSRTHSPNHQTAHTDAYRTYDTAYTTVSLMMNPRGSKHVGDNRN